MRSSAYHTAARAGFTPPHLRRPPTRACLIIRCGLPITTLDTFDSFVPPPPRPPLLTAAAENRSTWSAGSSSTRSIGFFLYKVTLGASPFTSRNTKADSNVQLSSSHRPRDSKNDALHFVFLGVEQGGLTAFVVFLG